MGFDINKITDAKLKEIAQEADKKGNKDGIINTEKEGNIFEKKGIKAGYTQDALVSALSSAFVEDEAVTDTFAKQKTQLDKYNEVKTAYEAKREEGLSPKNAYKAVKKEFDGKNYDTAIKRLKSYAKETDAFLTTASAVNEAADIAIEDQNYDVSGKDLKSDAKRVMKDDGEWDKWTKRQNNGLRKNFANWISGEDSAMKDYRKAQATRVHKVEAEQKTFTIEELTKELGKKNPYLQKNAQGQTVLEEAGLIAKQPDGKFKMTEKLIAILDEGVGDDNTLSRQKNKAVSETGNIIGDMAAEISPYEPAIEEVRVKDKYVKRLVKFAGNRVEKKQLGTMMYQNIIGAPLAAVVSGLSTGAALLMQGKDVVKFNATNNLHLDLNLNINGDANIDVDALNQAIQEAGLGDKASVISSGTNVRVIIDHQDVTKFVHVASKHIPENVLRSALTGGLIGLAISLLSSAIDFGKSEEEVIPTIQNCTTYEALVTKLNAMSTNKKIDPKYAEALKLIALKFVDKNGTLDCDKFIEFLGGAAGKGSRLNRTELIIALEKLQGKQPEQQTEQEEAVKTFDAEENCGTACTETVDIPTTKNVLWPNLADQYDCLAEYVPNKNERIRMMKVMQAVNNNDYTLANLKELTAKALQAGSNDAKIRAAFAGVEGFDVETYINVLHSPIIGTQKVPTIIIDENTTCERNANIKGNFKATGKAANNKVSGHANDTRTVTTPYSATTRTSDGKTQNYSDQTAFRTAVKDLEAGGYKKGNVKLCK